MGLITLARDVYLPLPVCPVHDAIDLLRHAIAIRKFALDIHVTSAKLHVSCFTVAHFLFRGLASGDLVQSADRKHCVFIPAVPAVSQSEIDQHESQLRADINRARVILYTVYPEWGPIWNTVFSPLICFPNDPISPAVKLSRAFSRLCRDGILPATVGNVLFTPLSIVMILQRCFWKESELISYLRENHGPVFPNPFLEGLAD